MGFPNMEVRPYPLGVVYSRVSPVGPWHPQPPNAKFTPLPLCSKLLVHTPEHSSMRGWGHWSVLRKNEPGSLDDRETTNWSHSATFWETKDKFPAARLVSYQRTHESLKVLPQEGARRMKPTYAQQPWETPEKP